jgi:hypothetical protein
MVVATAKELVSSFSTQTWYDYLYIFGGTAPRAKFQV